MVITGTYDLVLSTPSGLLSADAQAGKDTDITLTLTNNGNTDLQNINLTSTTPDGWAVEFSESTVELLEAGATKEGTATIAGHDCTREPLAVKSMVGYLPDNVGFYTDMTGRENLRFTGRLNGLSGDALEARIDGLLRRVGLEEAGDRKAGTYSRGMRQRLGIADVLIKDPRVIIMDEPTLGIDPEGMRDLLALIRRLSTQDQRTILLSSHQLQQVQQICDRVGIFVEGRLIACGPIAQLAKELRGDGGPILEVAATPNDAALKALLEHLEGLRQLRPMEGGGWLVQGEENLRPVLARLLLERGYDIQRLCQRSDDLDEIYHNYFEKAGASHDLPTDKKRGLLRRRA